MRCLGDVNTDRINKHIFCHKYQQHSLALSYAVTYHFHWVYTAKLHARVAWAIGTLSYVSVCAILTGINVSQVTYQAIHGNVVHWVREWAPGTVNQGFGVRGFGL